MFTCNNGTQHQHATVLESKVCYGFVKLPHADPIRPYAHRDLKDEPGSMSPRQESYLLKLGASVSQLFNEFGTHLSMNQASSLIDNIKNGRVGVTEPTAVYAAPVAPEDRRLTMVKAMFSAVPEGYFAVEDPDTSHLTFMRVSAPKTGRFRGTRKVQTQHGPRLELAVGVWPSGSWSIYQSNIIDSLLLLVVDYRGAAMRYAREIGKCMRCNAALTDERSRWYGIGPECENYWEWVIPRVDDEKGYPFVR